ncbi:MAG: hypothetical protein OHK0046_00340 [Anaerolineae bacterium]
MTTVDALLKTIFDGRKTALYAEFAEWVRGSRRFRAFAEQYQAKIRAKLSNVRDEGGMQDLRAELAAAVLLLREDRFMLEYEKYAASKQRGPDFTVTFKTHTPFNVEVRRFRSMELEEDDAEARLHKLMAVLCDKVGQMPPSIINVLWLKAEHPISDDSVTQAMAMLRQLAEHKNEVFFTRRGYASAADFLKRNRQLSGIVLHQPDSNSIWLNPLAKHKLPPEIVNALNRLI